MTGATPRDPRSIITPDAFEVAASLIGTPLATPRRRGVALALDGVVIGLITLVTKSFALLLGIVAAVLFVRAGFKRTPVRGSVFGRAMRISVGCLGLFIAGITAIIWASLGFDLGRGEGPRVNVDLDTVAARVLTGRLAQAGFFDQIEGAGSIEDAEDMARELVASAEDMGIERASIRAGLLALSPDDESWAGLWPDAVARVMDGAPAATSSAARRAIDDEVDSYSDEEALRAYAALVAARSDGQAEVVAAGEPADTDERLRALEQRLVGVVAADTVGRLRSRVEELQEAVASRDRTVERLEDDLADASSGGILDWVLGLLDELGIGFGWAAVYMTVVLSWWNGQTVGKRLMGIRVVRLDGEPITWWVAFERAGGYAAGVATGLLGFAQVWWDANRQAIHDRIVGTVVVVDGAEPVANWEEAL